MCTSGVFCRLLFRSYTWLFNFISVSKTISKFLTLLFLATGVFCCKMSLVFIGGGRIMVKSVIKYIKHVQNKPPFHGILPSVAALRELKLLTTLSYPKTQDTWENAFALFSFCYNPSVEKIRLWFLCHFTVTTHRHLITNRKKKINIIKDNNHKRKIYCRKAAEQAEGKGKCSLLSLCSGGTDFPFLMGSSAWQPRQ